jgi:hypothetical protein
MCIYYSVLWIYEVFSGGLLQVGPSVTLINDKIRYKFQLNKENVINNL